MRLLLDTSRFLWFVAGSERLSGKARELMEDFDNELVLSVASLWEMAIKASIGKLELLGHLISLSPKNWKKMRLTFFISACPIFPK